jgi:hypothetical protein
MNFDKDYWENRYRNNETGWDIGHASFPLTNYFDGIKNKKARILIPGAGNAYEAEYLHNKGFTNVFVLDLAKSPLEALKKRCPDFPDSNLILGDFFEHYGEYDFIVEQTFFCALNPELRKNYVSKMSMLMTKDSLLLGLLFDDPLNGNHPPFGGSEEEYRRIFSEHFIIQSMHKAPDSIAPRLGRELFFIAKKRL